MSREEWRSINRGSNVPLDRSVTKDFLPAAERISFRDLAMLGYPVKTALALAADVGDSERTCKRWLAGATRAPDRALVAVWLAILRRYR